jgi:hypothetical protein
MTALMAPLSTGSARAGKGALPDEQAAGVAADAADAHGNRIGREDIVARASKKIRIASAVLAAAFLATTSAGVALAEEQQQQDSSAQKQPMI